MSRARRRRTTTTPSPTSSLERVEKTKGRISRPSDSSRSPQSPPATSDRPQLSSPRRRREAQLADRQPPRTTTRRLGAGRRTRLRLGRDRSAVRLLRGDGLESRSASSPSPTTGAETTIDGPRRVLRVSRRCAEDGADRPDGMSEGWRRRRTWSSRRLPTCASPRTTDSRRTSAKRPTPSSKGIVENLVGYVKSDLMIPEELDVARPSPGERDGPGLDARR